MSEEERKFKGPCGICDTPLYDDDDRRKRKPEEPYICEGCWEEYRNYPCADCTDLFHCSCEHDWSACGGDE